ncbi:Baseplate hub assembly protein, bacteriophage T4-like [uncultured Caudovirales phage]|uniref:Baseplate hub assembly protein, bacteriophage T4-like n=1 Tax=uncultured Caudovirales phage TaxID=2100421 RepID=A0A6J7WGG2_9CAUD|nr:Baseplate hub assembly protein, bacteriophage T4-like [uncultured Caudovirales phage]
MENTTNNALNPLSKFFRQPSIYLKLPSNGRFWPENSVELPVTGELPIYPMTARDEITLRTPDALMNGAGIVEVIQSCCPNIKDAWKMPSVDVDAVLIAIRIASYGNGMPVDTNCPHCGEENNHEIDLRVSLANVTCPNYDRKIDVDNLKIKVKPQAYFGVNRKNTISYEEQRMMAALESSDEDELRIKEIADSMSRLVQIGIDTITDSTEYIELGDGTVVNNKDFIREFYNNANGATVRTIQERLGAINNEGAIKPQTASCSKCTKSYDIPLMFDYANFFANGS